MANRYTCFATKAARDVRTLYETQKIIILPEIMRSISKLKLKPLSVIMLINTMIKEANMNINSPRFKVISIITVAILSLSLFVLVSGIFEKSNADTDNIYSFKDADDAVQYYLKLMEKEKFKVEFFEDSMGGMVPYRTEYEGITLTEGEKNGTFKNHNQKSDFSNVRVLQRKYILELFGEGAWGNCTYELDRKSVV